jgi:hypothetical protein
MRKIAIILILTGLISCQQTLTDKRAVYFWKTTFDFSPKDTRLLKQIEVGKIYLRLFDLDYDAKKQAVKMLAPLAFVNNPPKDFIYTPVVYITNKVISKTAVEEINILGTHILQKIDFLCKKGDITYKEIQIDCDWTETTKDKYFQLLAFIKADLNKKNKILSATIRLHQIKYAEITGIPPVDRGMLMYYNMGKIGPKDGNNSIFNKLDAQKYTKYLAYYPLPLDLALPVFSWGIQIRKERIVSLLNNITAADLEVKDKFINVGENKYKAVNSFFYKGTYYMKDDYIKLDEIKPEDVKSAVNLVLPYFKNKKETIALYHYNALITNGYEKKTIKKIYSYFH